MTSPISGVIAIPLHDAVGEVSVRYVPATLDVSADGEIIGVEILDLVHAVGTSKRAMAESLRMTNAAMVTYDPANDAFYLRLGTGHSREQPAAIVKLSVDSREWLTSIEVPWDSTSR